MMNYYSNQYNPGVGQYVPQSGLQFLKGRPVTSLEEVRAAQIDFDGTLFVFPDIANKKIYTKQINVDGTAAINLYELSSLPTVTNIDSNEYVTKAEFNKTLEELKSLLENPQTAPATTKQGFDF